ncbi:hypothetical protein ABUW04_33010 [Streptacidiphilus sp. N1-10]|uniref:Uncharacterized protein n=1 Tax=Streptacidiphilus jeojiensis TaxID=3229225 RepID=A0ABV6XXR4_9ACTN
MLPADPSPRSLWALQPEPAGGSAADFLLHPSLSDLLYAVVAAMLLSGLGCLVRQARVYRRRELRRYTLLGTQDAHGNPLLYDTTRNAGNVLIRVVEGHRSTFELTDVQLRDGTYAAEPLDSYL